MAKPEIIKPGNNGDLPHISNPSEYPSPDEPIIVRLTTGRIIEMVIGEVETFLERGEIPNELIGIAARELLPPPKDETEEHAAKRIADRYRLAKWTTRTVVRRGGPTERFFAGENWEVYNLANSPAMALANFRLQQAIHVDMLAQQQDIGLVAEPTTTGVE